MARTKSLLMAVVLIIMSAGLAWGVDYNSPLDMDMYMIPTLNSSYMTWDNQTHTREYHYHGTCRFEYDSNYTAYSPEVYQLEGTATFNWVTHLYSEHVELKSGGKVLTLDAWSNWHKLDPMLFYTHSFSASGTLFDYTPDPNGNDRIVKIWLSSPSWENKTPLKWPKVSPDMAIMPYIAKRSKMGKYRKDEQEREAKTLHFNNEQDQYFTRGEKILFVASQYIPDDFFVDDWETMYTPEGAVTNRPLFFYGTKAEVTFQFKGEKHDTWSPVRFTRQVDMHGNAVITSLDTSGLTPGPWEVSARIIAMGSYEAKDYPVSTLRFNLVQKLNLWNGFDSSRLTISPSIDYHNITIQAPMSKGQFFFQYNPVPMPIVGPTFEKTYPLAIEADSRNLKFDLPKPGKAADLYLGFALPDNPGAVFLLYPDQTLHPLAAGPRPWKSDFTGPVDEVIFDGAAIASLPKGLTLEVYILLTPHGDLNNYYFWKTFITTR